ncbi:prolyl oligopeptidase family serine peptidase [soil metagenome]
MVNPPPTPRGDDVDRLHGTDVADPYRWLEDTADREVGKWLTGQNTFTRQALDSLPERSAWHQRLVSLMSRPLVGAVQLRNDTVIMLERLADADQSVLTVRRFVAGAEVTGSEPVVLVDPAAGGDATAAIDWYEASPDGALVAYGTSIGGTERSILRIVATDDPATEHIEDIPDTRACSVAWEPDGSGFFYTRYPAGEEYDRTVRHHRLGADWRDDAETWAELPNPESWPDVKLSQDGRWLLVSVEVGWSRTDVHVLDRHHDRWWTIVSGVESETRLEFAADGLNLVGMTTIDASGGRLVRISLPAFGDAARSAGDWITLVAERDAVISSPHVVGDEIWIVTTSDGIDTVERRSGDGSLLGSLDSLGMISVLAVAADRDAERALVVRDSFDGPPSVWHAAAGTDEVVPWWEAHGDVTASEMSVRHVTYASPDGTQIGMFLIHGADVTPDASTPTILNGYGGFAIAETPTWSPQIAAWCSAGGLYAIAQLRGGLEHGEDWHLAGNRQHKQNVFDDFAAAADWLVDQGLTSRARLAIVGRSNGGLLVGAALTQRPDLCRAVWCGVPLLDMIRFPQFLIARLWTSEYGDPEIAEEFAWLHAYSPYHHVESGTCYPAVLLTAAEGDSRVHPGHARKMTAALQHASSCLDTKPVLLIEERDAGHGVGKPVSLRAAEVADALTFLSWQLGWVPSPAT